MARKKKEEVILTPEQEMDECIKSYFNTHEDRIVNEPTYLFNVEDKVKFGGFAESIVKRVLDKGKYYVLYNKMEKKNYGSVEVTYQYNVVPWHVVRRLDTKGTDFTNHNSIRLDFLNCTIDSLLSYYYGFGIDMEPEYQRELVWDDRDKEKLLDSIFFGADIGKFVIIRLSDTEWKDNDYKVGFEILDGKQRLSTLIEFFEDRFLYHGCTYSDLSKEDKYTFNNTPIGLAKVQETTMKDRYRLFLALNNSGRVMSEEQLNKVEKLYESC